MLEKLVDNAQFWTWLRCTTLTIIVVAYVHFGYKNPPTTVDFAFWINVVGGIWGIDFIKGKAINSINQKKEEEEDSHENEAVKTPINR